MTRCDIDNDECLGEVEAYDDELTLCTWHQRALGEVGERGFREWYSVELVGGE